MRAGAIDAGRNPPGDIDVIIAVRPAKLTHRDIGIRDCSDVPTLTREQIRRLFRHSQDLEPGTHMRSVG
jgi:hypothetical protein